MPRYYFDVHDGVDFYDLEGTECRDIEHVRREGSRLLPEMALEHLSSGLVTKTYVLRVRDHSGTVVYSAKLTFEGQ